MGGHAFNPNNPRHAQVMSVVRQHIPKEWTRTKDVAKACGFKIPSYESDTVLTVLNALADKPEYGKIVVRQGRGIESYWCARECLPKNIQSTPKIRREHKSKFDGAKPTPKENEMEALRKKVEELESIVANMNVMPYQEIPKNAPKMISYEELTEIRKKEENSSYLSSVPSDLRELMQRTVDEDERKKKKILAENPDMYDGVASRAKKTWSIIDRIIFVRTCKISHLAQINASGGIKVIPENMTDDEKRLYDQLFKLFSDIEIIPNKEVN